QPFWTRFSYVRGRRRRQRWSWIQEQTTRIGEEETVPSVVRSPPPAGGARHQVPVRRGINQCQRDGIKPVMGGGIREAGNGYGAGRVRIIGIDDSISPAAGVIAATVVGQFVGERFSAIGTVPVRETV